MCIYAYHNSLPIRTIFNAVTVVVVRLISYRHVAPHLDLLSLSTTKMRQIGDQRRTLYLLYWYTSLEKSTLYIHKYQSAAKYSKKKIKKNNALRKNTCNCTVQNHFSYLSPNPFHTWYTEISSDAALVCQNVIESTECNVHDPWWT